MGLCRRRAPPPVMSARRGCAGPRLSVGAGWSHLLCRLPGADHHPVHRLPGPHLLLLLRVPGREGRRERVGPGRVRQLRGRPLVGGGKSGPWGHAATAHPEPEPGRGGAGMSPWGSGVSRSYASRPPHKRLKPRPGTGWMGGRHRAPRTEGPHAGCVKPDSHHCGVRKVFIFELAVWEASLAGRRATVQWA